MEYVAPMIRSFSKKEIENNLVASASCSIAFCGAGTTFTCNASTVFAAHM